MSLLAPSNRDRAMSLTSPDHWRRPRGDATFALAILAIGVLTVFILSRGGTALNPAASPRSSAVATPGKTTPTQPSAAVVVPATVRAYLMPNENADLMLPAVDAQGNVWFGEMGTNKLGRLDPRTGAVTTWTPPGGQFGIMGIVAGPDGAIWFAEQAANYIGRFDPGTAQFRVFPLERSQGRPTAPQSVAFDTHGKLWFTGVTSGTIGRLDPNSGLTTTWRVPGGSASAPAYPFGLALTPDGGVWFAELAGGTLGRLDPTSGQFRLYHSPTRDAQVFSLAAAPDGRLWFSELQYGRLGVLDPRTGAVREIAIPGPVAPAQNIYQVAVAANGDVWVPSLGENALVRYTPSSGTFTIYTLSAERSQPYGLTLDAAGHVWFTADLDPKNFVGMLTP